MTVKFQIKYTLLRVYDTYLTKYCVNPGRLALFRRNFINNSIHKHHPCSKFKKDALAISAQSLMGIRNLVKHAH